MDNELLIKLIKLANHNPNENEANLAARKVCAIIEDEKFNLINSNQAINIFGGEAVTLNQKDFKEMLRKFGLKI